MCATIHIFLIALMIQSGLAIKCYNCDSASDEHCEKMTDKEMKAEECDDEKERELERDYNKHDRHWLLKASDVRYRRSKSDAAKMICQKLVGLDEQKQKTVVRRCQLADVDCCNYTQQQLATALYPKGLEIESCDVCHDKDGCNGTSDTQAFGIMIGVAIAVAMSRYIIL